MKAREAIRGVLGRQGGPARPSTDDALTLLDPEDRRIVEAALPYTMTGVARLSAVIDAVRYCVRRDVPGAFVECGVWKGGSMLATILTLQAEGVDDRDVYLFDTFTGMTAPTERDVSRFDPPAEQTWNRAAQTSERPWAELFEAAGFDERSVCATLEATGYRPDRVHLVAGDVEETLPASAPEQVALLRLDTDWYESTRHELVHLYPRVPYGGVLIVDDYGHWQGCREAVDEYFAGEVPMPMLTRIDYTGRIAVKQ